MAETADIAFAFNPNAIINGVKQATAAMSGMTQSVQVIGGQLSSMTSTIASGIGKFAVKLAGIAAAYVGISAIVSRIPEIGEAFSIAGDIFWRNFLYPLRQELLPLLNQMLLWVSNNRAMFVKWGMMLVSVFRILKSAVEGVINLLSAAFRGLSRTLESVFGKVVIDIGAAMKVLLAKVAFIVIALEVLLEPVFELIGKIIGFLLIGLKGAFDGVMESSFFRDAGETLEFIYDLLEEIGTAISSAFGEGNAKGFYEVMKAIGHVIGDVIGGALRIWRTYIGGIVEGFKEMMASGTTIGDLFDELKTSVGALFKTLKGIFASVGGGEAKFENILEIVKFIGKIIGGTIAAGIKVVVFALTLAVKAVTTILDGAVAITNTFNALGTSLGGLGDTMLAGLGEVGKWAEGMWEGMKNGFNRAWVWIKSQLAGFKDWVKDKLPKGFVDKLEAAVSVDAAKPEGKAAGGPVSGGTPYIVGERGPELFVPRSSGNIVPNGGGGSNYNVSITVTEGSAYQAGVNFSQGMQRQSLLDEAQRMGKR